MIESLCLYLHCLSAALLCYTGFQDSSFIRSTSCSCSTCCFCLGFQLQKLQDFIKVSRALIKDIFLNLVPPDSLASWRHRVATCGQEAKIGKIGRLGRPTRVGLCGDLVLPSLDSWALISPPVPSIGIWLVVRLAAYCSPRGWSRDGAEHSKKYKIGQRGTHRKWYNFGVIQI